MSGNIRKACVVSSISSVVLGSWIAVRALAASPAPVLDDPPISMTAFAPRELRDDGLAEAIHRLATLAPASVRSPLASR